MIAGLSLRLFMLKVLSQSVIFFDCERMQRSPIHSFVVVVFDFQVCEIFVLNEGKLKHVDKTC